MQKYKLELFSVSIHIFVKLFKKKI